MIDDLHRVNVLLYHIVFSPDRLSWPLYRLRDAELPCEGLSIPFGLAKT